MSAEKFLDLYKQLEDLLEEKYMAKKRRYSSVVFEYLNDDESKPVRENIDVCREIRNLLAHTAKIGGEDVVEPSENVINALCECIAYVKRPPTALEFATRGDQIFKAGYNQTAIKIMGIMDKNGYSHVPIIQNGEFMGVFSTSTLFSFLLTNCGVPISKTTTIAELHNQLPINAHIENYEFAPIDLTLSEARRKFETVKEKNKRLSVIFITQTGNAKERLLGMLTPWDVLKEI